MKYTYSRGCFNISSEIELPENHVLFSLLDASTGDRDVTSLNDELECEVFTAIMAIITDSRVYLSVDADSDLLPMLTFTWNICDGDDVVFRTIMKITKTVAMTNDLRTRIDYCSRRFLSRRLSVVDMSNGDTSYRYCVKSSALKIRRKYIKVDKGLRVDGVTKCPVIKSLGSRGTHEDLLFWVRADRMTKLPWWWRLWCACTKGKIAFVKFPHKYSTRSADLNTVSVKF